MGEPPARALFLPGQHIIDAYGNGGFRFAEMGHRGSLMILPSGMRAWPVTSLANCEEETLAPLFAEAAGIQTCLVGTGIDALPLPEPLRWRFRECRIGVETMATGAAARTYNILLAERRRVAAALIAVG